MSTADKWDDGCKEDEVRNEFVIPKLVQLINEMRPSQVLDIGTGTGYIVRSVDACVRQKPEWTLIDMDEERIAFAVKEMSQSVNFKVYTKNFMEDEIQGGPFDFVLLLFTLLELDLKMELFSKVKQLTSENGYVVITMPDSLEDVLKSAVKTPSLLSDFVKGRCVLGKVDKFTEEEYPFKAHRFEYIVQLMLQSSFSLIKMFSHMNGDNETFMLVFKKMVD